MVKEISTMVSVMCINPELKKPYPVTIIQKSMKDIHFSVKLNQNSKQQALQVIRQLKETIPIQRVKMRLLLVLSNKHGKKVKDKLFKLTTIEMESEESEEGQVKLVFLIDPGDFKEVDDMVKAETKGTAFLEVLSYKELTEEEKTEVK